MMKLYLTLKHRFNTEEKLFGGLFPIENDFPKYFAKCRSLLYLFKHFVSHIKIIPRNDTLLYHSTNPISFKVLLLHSFMT